MTKRTYTIAFKKEVVQFIEAWESSGDVEICSENMEAVPQEDELDYE